MSFRDGRLVLEPPGAGVGSDGVSPFGRLVTARELDGLAPLAEEADWARAVSRSEQHLLSLVVALKCFQRLGYFPRAGQVPPAVFEQVRGCLGLSAATEWAPPDRTGR